MNINKITVGALKENCYVVEESDYCFIVDPGDESQRIVRLIGSSKLKFILLTHGHFDHLLALEDIYKYFPDTSIYIAKEDKDLIQNLSEQSHYVRHNLNNIDLAVNTVNDGDLITFNKKKIKVLATPGHTLGSVCYLLKNNIFSGDTLFFHAIGRTDLWTSDQIAMSSSLRKLSKLPPTSRVYPGHGRVTTVLEELQNGYLPND